MSDTSTLQVVIDPSGAVSGAEQVTNAVNKMANSSKTAFGDVSSSLERMNKFLSAANSGISAFFTTLGAGAAMKSFMDRMIDVNTTFNAFIATMTVINGSISKSKDEFNYIVGVANKLGVSVESIIKQYGRLAAALKSVDTTGQMTRQVFEAISAASSVLHMKGYETNLLFNALEQSVSKGKVSLEEFQRQLGNKLPGAMRMAAEAMNMTQAEFRSAVTKGSLDVNEVVIKLATQIKKEYGDASQIAAEMFTGQMMRMQNAITQLYVTIGQSGAIDGLTKIAKAVTGLFSDPEVGKVFGEALYKLFSDIADWISKITSSDIKDFFDGLSGIIDAFSIIVKSIVTNFSDLVEGKADFLSFGEGVANVMNIMADAAMTFASALALLPAMAYEVAMAVKVPFAGLKAIFDLTQGKSIAEVSASLESDMNQLKTSDKLTMKLMDIVVGSENSPTSKSSALIGKVFASMRNDRANKASSDAAALIASQTNYENPAYMNRLDHPADRAWSDYGIVSQPSNPTNKGKGKVDDYTKIMESVQAKINLQTAELASDEKLNEADKLKIDLYTKIDAGLLKLNLKQKLSLDASLDELDTKIKLVNAHKLEEKAIVAATEAREKHLTSLASGLDKMKTEVETQREFNDRIGLSKEAISELDATKLESQAVTLELLAIKAMDKNMDMAQYDLYKAQAKELRTLGELKKEGAVKQADVDRVKALTEENAKAAKESEKYWEDAFMRAFESGKGFFQSLWDTIKNTLKTQVLKVTVQGVMGSLGIGAAGAATAGQGGGSMQDAFSSNVFSNFGGSVASTTGKAASWLINNGFDTVGQSAADLAKTLNDYSGAITTAGNTIGYASALYSASQGKWGTAIGQGIGTYFGGPIGSAIGGAIGGWVDSAFGGGGGPKTESSYGNMAGLGNTSATGLAGTYATSIENMWAGMAKQFGLSNKLKVGALTSSDPQGTANTDFNASATVNGQQVYSRYDRMGGRNPSQTGRSEAELQAAMNDEVPRIMLAALKASDIGTDYKNFLNTVSTSATAEVIQAALDKVGVISQFRDSVNALPFAQLRDLSFAAADGLIAAAGGMQALGANLGTYYSNFYTQEEQRAQAIKNINKVTLSLGLDASTATKEMFRQLVESQDLTTASGQKTYAALLGISGAFATLADSSTTVVKSVAAATLTMDTSGAALKASMEANALAAKNFMQSLADGYQTGLDNYQKTIDKFDAFTESLKKFQDSLKLGADSTLSAKEKYDLANSNFVNTSQQASIGNEKAISDLPNVITAFLSASKQYSTDSLSYSRDFSRSNVALNTAQQYTQGMSAQAAQDMADYPARMAAFYAAVRESFAAQGITGFAVGTNFVPNDMTAKIHAGERIIPAADNAELMDRLNSPAEASAVLVSEIRELRAVMEKQQTALDNIQKTSARTSSTLINVTNGGNTLLTTAA
jgi:tape measure domain-containing protein